MRAEPVRNIGIMAHVDAGKTTLTEQLLYASGVIRTPGRVDHGTSLTDSLEVEKKRGITVRAASVVLNWKETNIRIIDTPGHADFYPEVERSIRALDGAVLVVSSVEGVQLQTLAIWTALRELGIPTLIFVNKLDRVGSEPHKLLEDMQKQLSTSIFPMQFVSRAERKTPRIIPISDHQQTMVKAMECLAHQDEQMMHRYAHDERTNWDEMDGLILRLTKEGKVFPVFFGVAMTGLGVSEVLDGVINYLPGPKGSNANDLSAVIFKVETGNVEGRMVHVRVFEGTIGQRLGIHNERTGKQEKAVRILRLARGRDYENTATLEAGDIGVLFGLQDSKVGHVLGSGYAIPNISTPVEPMLTAKIFPEQGNEWNELLEALQRLEDEDPLLNVEWLEEQREIHLRFFGEVQMEIVCNMLFSRFNLVADFSEPCVIYKETPAGVGEAGIKFRDGGYADLELRIEPLPTGSGFEYESLISGDNKIYQKFMKQIPQILEKIRNRGPSGREITDLKVVLVDGYCKYDLGTKPEDYKIVTPIVFNMALEKSGTRLLEPVMDFHISVPEEYGSQIYRDLVKMRAQFKQPAADGERLLFTGRVPFAETFKYTPVLYASSHGQGILKTKFCGYCPVEKTQ